MTIGSDQDPVADAINSMGGKHIHKEVTVSQLRVCGDIYYVFGRIEFMRPWLSFLTHNSSMESAMELKCMPFGFLLMPFLTLSCLARIEIFRFWPKTMDYT